MSSFRVCRARFENEQSSLWTVRSIVAVDEIRTALNMGVLKLLRVPLAICSGCGSVGVVRSTHRLGVDGAIVESLARTE